MTEVSPTANLLPRPHASLGGPVASRRVHGAAVMGRWRRSGRSPSDRRPPGRSSWRCKPPPTLPLCVRREISQMIPNVRNVSTTSPYTVFRVACLSSACRLCLLLCLASPCPLPVLSLSSPCPLPEGPTLSPSVCSSLALPPLCPRSCNRYDALRNGSADEPRFMRLLGRSPRAAQFRDESGGSWPTAATPVDNPYCSCKPARRGPRSSAR